MMKVWTGIIYGVNGAMVSGKFMSLGAGEESAYGYQHTDVVVWLEDNQGNKISTESVVFSGPTTSIASSIANV